MSIEILRSLYTLSIETLFPKADAILYRGDPTARSHFPRPDNTASHYLNTTGDYVKYNTLLYDKVSKRRNNIALFFSRFCDFYSDVYNHIVPVCVSDITYSPKANITYTLPAQPIQYNESYITKIPHLEEFTFADNGFNIPIAEGGTNILIVGAGPVGLYLAGILKACAPHIEVNILEKRVSDERKRQFTRIGKLILRYLGVQNTFNAVNKMNDLLAKACPALQSTFIGLDSTGKHPTLRLIHHIEQISSHDKTSINTLELLLGNFAQKMGVNIYHDNKIDNLEYIESNYVNRNTKYIFDTTGGRLIRNNTIHARFEVIRQAKQDYNEIKNRKAQEGTSGKPFNVKEGTLTPEQAIFKEKDYIYIALGETFMKIDYNEGKSIAVGAAMSVALCLVILRELGHKKGSAKRSTRKKGHKVKMS